MTGLDTVLLAAAGVLAGAVGSAGGITSLVSYPALLAVGLAPLAANVTQAVAFVACWPGSALGSRPELSGQGRWLRRWAPLAALGAITGVVLLLAVPAAVFDRVVPFLLVLASACLLAQPRLSAWHERHLGHGNGIVLVCGLFAVSIYNGYFGAGSGVMTLVVLLLTVHPHLPRANTLKNFLLGITDLVAAVVFVFLAPVHWSAAVPLAAGLLAGASVGPALTRRLPGALLRGVVALAGLGLAARLFVVWR